MADATASLADASDVSHSTAYVVLNTLVDEGQVVEERAEYLKQKFKDLHTRVLTIYKRDNTLLKRARQLRSQLDVERQRVHAHGDVARKDDEEILRLKRSLMELEKDLTSAQERESILQVEALELDRRKQNLILEREDAMAAEEARLRPKMENVQNEINEMSAQIKEMISTYQELQRKQAALLADEETCKSEVVNFATILAQAKQQYVNVEHDPERATKQLRLITHGLAGAKKELSCIEEKINTQTETIGKLELRHSNRTSDYAAAKANLSNIRNEIDSKRKTLATMNTSLEVELETRQGFQDRLHDLEQLIKSTKISVKQEADAVERLHREKEKSVREYSGLEQAREDLLHEQQSLRDQISFVKKDMDQVDHTCRGVRKQIEAGKKDIEVRTARLLKEQTKEKDFAKKADTLLDDIRSVEELIQEKTRQEEVKRRQLMAVVTRRQEMNRECAREDGRVLLMKKELHTKDVHAREASRTKDELDRRLSSLMTVFHGVKNERSQKAAQIQGITQKMTEVAEKTKILENELEVLLRESALKEKELTKKKRQAHEINQYCTNLRLEKNKQRKKLESVADSEREIKAQVRRFNGDIAATEDTMMELRDTYEAAAESRNQTGIQLIDRNDELGLLVEKVKAQEVALAQGAVLTNSKTEEVRVLKLRLVDLMRDIELCQRSIPKVRQLEEELATLTEEIDDERWRAGVLENDLTDPSNPHRWRKIDTAIGRKGGSDVPAPVVADGDDVAPSKAASPRPVTTTTALGSGEEGAVTGGNAHTGSGAALPPGNNPTTFSGNGPSDEYVRLQARCQNLEARVNNITEQLREKDLILAEVTELSESIGAQAVAGREFTLALAKQVNEQQSGIRQRTRQMMATISELSLFQASSIQLQQEVQRLEDVVQEAERRLQAGEAPFAEATEEYDRAKESDRRYAEMLQRRREETQLPARGPNTIATTAIPRPNAYVPDSELGLPRPFGPFAPFKPSTPSPTMHSTPVVAAPPTARAGWSAAGPTSLQLSPQQSGLRSSSEMVRDSQAFSSSVPADHSDGRATHSGDSALLNSSGRRRVTPSGQQTRLSQRGEGITSRNGFSSSR